MHNGAAHGIDGNMESLDSVYQTTRTTWIQQEQKYFYSRKVAPDGVAKPAYAGIFGLRRGWWGASLKI